MRWTELSPSPDKVRHWVSTSRCSNGTLMWRITRWSGRQAMELWCEQIRGWHVLAANDRMAFALVELKLRASRWAKALETCILRRAGGGAWDVPGAAFRRARKLVEGR